MDRLKMMKENLISCVQTQISGNLANVDTEELGDAIDMIKDLEEAIYYCTITKAMEEGDKEKKEGHHQQQPQHQYQQPMYYPYYRDMDRDHGRLYYDDIYYGGRRYMDGANGSGHMGSNGNVSSGNTGGEGRNSFTERYPVEMRDYREGRSPIMRKSYMESKEMHKDAKIKMQELEKYMQELTQDIVEMIEGATPEEKQVLQQKLMTLSNKIK